MTSKSKVKAKQTVDSIEFQTAPEKGQHVILHTEVDQSPATQMLRVIDKASTDPRTNVEKMRALLDMQMELVREQRRMEYNTAMWEAQGEMVPIVARAYNESTRSHFAKLAHVDNAVRPIYRKHGFSLSFTSKKEDDGSITMRVKILHRNGHEDFAELNMHIDDKGPKGTQNKTQPQGVASSASILQRKLTVMVFNLTFINEDDDGQGGIIEKGSDPFADKLKKPEPEISLHDQLRQEAAKLEAALKERAVEKRGGLFMKNTPLINQLNEVGMQDVAENLRAIAEGTNERQ